MGLLRPAFSPVRRFRSVSPLLGYRMPDCPPLSPVSVAPLRIDATDEAAQSDADRLVYHPETLAVGVGCERDTPPEAVEALVRETLAEAGLSPASVACVVSVDVKADEVALHTVAASLVRPARFFTPERLEEETPRLARPRSWSSARSDAMASRKGRLGRGWGGRRVDRAETGQRSGNVRHSAGVRTD